MAKDYNPSRRNREAFEALTETPGNVPPQAVELEEAVLGALMLEKDSIIAVQEYVTPDAFYTEEHRTIYKAIEELSMELKPIDLYTVTERLKGKKELKKVGGASYLAQLTQKVGSAANVEFHAKIIAQKYVQRELIRSATEIQRRSYDESTDVTELIGYAESEIFKVAEGHVKRSVQSSKDLLAKALMQIEEASKNTSAFNGVPSGFMAIDRGTLGWQLSDLIIVAARPSMGKTAFVLSMARNMAVDHERPVAFFSLIQATLLMVVLQFGLQLQIDNVPAFYAMGYLTALVFAAIMQMLMAAFGFPGKFVAIILLLLQLTACAGTFPIQTTPDFFQVINPCMPMTYVVQGMRQIMTGLDYGIVGFDCFVLFAIGAACFALTCLVAYRKRTVRMEDLHPVLQLG